MTDIINKPPHYTHSPIETIDVIEAWRLGFHLGNALKYISRADHKGKRLEDLRKAAWYLAREIEREERAEAEPAAYTVRVAYTLEQVAPAEVTRAAAFAASTHAEPRRDGNVTVAAPPFDPLTPSPIAAGTRVKIKGDVRGTGKCGTVAEYDAAHNALRVNVDEPTGGSVWQFPGNLEVI